MIEKNISNKEIGECNQSNRLEWVSKTLGQLPAGLSIIDVGAGECQYKKYCSHLNYTSQDFNQYDGKGDSIGLQTGEWERNHIDIVSDIVSIPVSDNSFDIVLCTEVLEHVPDPISAINEMNRILKVGGTMILTSPFCSMTHFAPYHFCDGFNKYFYEYHFKRLRYEILEISENGNYFESLAQEIIRLPSIINSYSNKAPNRFLGILTKYYLKTLKYYNQGSAGSEKLMCHGYHVRVIKKH